MDVGDCGWTQSYVSTMYHGFPAFQSRYMVTVGYKPGTEKDFTLDTYWKKERGRLTTRWKEGIPRVMEECGL
jgi:hypothetical protein